VTKQRHIGAVRDNAKATLSMLNVAIGQDFHTLRSDQVERLLAEADRVRYQKPANASGSRARYFYERLQREAQREQSR
jgi:hypothetical protein